MGWKWYYSLIWVSLSSHLLEISLVFPPRILPASCIKVDGLRLGRVQFDPVSKVFLMEVSSNRVPFKCVNGSTSEGSWIMYSGLRMLLLEGECINVEERLSLEGEIVRYSSVSLSPTLGRNEKVDQYIRKKTHKPNALRFWVEGGVIFLYVGSVLILVRSPRCFHMIQIKDYLYKKKLYQPLSENKLKDMKTSPWIYSIDII